jgi:hypothetical protein
MDKDEALKLALEALEAALSDDQPYIDKSQEAITAIKQARALDKKAENTMIYRTFEQWKSGNVLEHGVPRTEYYSEDQLDLVEMGWNYGYDAGRAVEQALDKKAENARELGLDYEPVLKDNSNYRYDPPVAEPVAIPEYIRDAAKHLHENRFEPSFVVRAIVGWINGSPPAQPAPVQKPVAYEYGDDVFWHDSPDINDYIRANGKALVYATPPAQPAPVQPVAYLCENAVGHKYFRWKKPSSTFKPIALYTTPPAAAVLEGRDWSLLEATQESLREHIAEIKRLKEAQPAVPDAMTSADIQEHIEYVAGWNDCRAEMLKGMKP